VQSTHSIAIQKKGNKIQKYESKNNSDLPGEGDIVGFDANILVDLVESDEFKKSILEEVEIGIWKIYTTNIALGEARHVLIKKKGYTKEEATKRLQNIIKEFKIIKINHNREGELLGEKWVGIVKKKMFIKKWGTFPNDCKILSNLFKQAGVNIYFTEDQDIEKAINILEIPIKVRVVGEASQIDAFEVKRFFKEQFKRNRKASYKRRKRR
jgi:predicted nucleic acid-binding protein